MSEKSVEDVRNMLKDVKHPSIDRTLLELGIIKEITVEGNTAKILMALPFPKIPILDLLQSLVKTPLEKEGMEVVFDTTTMNPIELNQFLMMEQAGWKGM